MCTPCRTTDGVNAKSYLVTIEIQQIFNHVGKLLPILLSKQKSKGLYSNTRVDCAKL